MTLLLVAACAHLPAVQPTPPPELVSPFALEVRGYTMTGTLAVKWAEDERVLVGLTPLGTSLFDVRLTAEGAEVTAPSDELAAYLSRLPFQRDLVLLFGLDCPEPGCRTTEGRLRVRGDTASWRGEGGPARRIQGPDTLVLEDRRRAYVLTVSREGS